MNPTLTQCRSLVARSAVLCALACVIVIGVCYAVVKGLGYAAIAHDVAMAGGVLLLAGLPGLVLSVVLTGRLRGGASFGFVAGIAVRLPVGGVVALNGLNWGLAQTQWFPRIVAGAYLVLLVIEVLCLSPAVKRTAAVEARTPSVEKPSGDDEESV